MGSTHNRWYHVLTTCKYNAAIYEFSNEDISPPMNYESLSITYGTKL